MQHTISGNISVQGIGIHSGKLCKVTIEEGDPDTGIVFFTDAQEDDISVATDVAVKEKEGITVSKNATVSKGIKASIDVVSDTRGSTTLGLNGRKIQTVEHLLAALYGMEIDNVTITTSSKELPILDGSASNWLKFLFPLRRISQEVVRNTFYVTKFVRIEEENRYIEAHPSNKLEITYIINHPDTPIGHQEYYYCFSPETFSKEIAQARTYGFLEEVAALYRRDLGLGGGLENCVVVTKDRYLNQLRYPDEMVRHKILDFIGDVSLLSSKVYGRFVVYQGNHNLHIRLFKKLVENDRVA